MEGTHSPAAGLTSASFGARIILPLRPSVLLVPFICVVSGLQTLSDLWSPVSPTSFLPLKFVNSFLTSSGIRQFRFLLALSFTTLPIPSGAPTEEAFGCLAIYMKKPQAESPPCGSLSDQFKRVCSLRPGMQTLEPRYLGPLSLQGSDREYQWHRLFYSHCLAHPRGSLALSPHLHQDHWSVLFIVSPSVLTVLF